MVLFTIIGAEKLLCVENKPDVVKSSSMKVRNRLTCIDDDTNCGVWVDRSWIPNSCKYRDVSGDDARRCMANKTVACVGDSQMRDLCLGLTHILYDVTVDEIPDDMARSDKNMLLLADHIPLLPHTLMTYQKLVSWSHPGNLIVNLTTSPGRFRHITMRILFHLIITLWMF